MENRYACLDESKAGPKKGFENPKQFIPKSLKYCLDHDFSPDNLKSKKPKILNLCLWNARSIKHKTQMIRNFRMDHDIDVFLL